MNILIKLDDKFANDWIHMVGKTNMVAKLFEYKYQKDYAAWASNIYCKRQEVINELEGKFISPLIKLRNKYDWLVNASHGILLVSIDDAFAQYEIDYLKQSKLSFVSSIENSEDDFGNNAEMRKLIELYNATQPKPIGFAP